MLNIVNKLNFLLLNTPYLPRHSMFCCNYFITGIYNLTTFLTFFNCLIDSMSYYTFIICTLLYSNISYILSSVVYNIIYIIGIYYSSTYILLIFIVWPSTVTNSFFITNPFGYYPKWCPADLKTSLVYLILCIYLAYSL